MPGNVKNNPEIPVTHLRMSTAPKGKHALHVGLAPFRDADGSFVASYQVINDQGVAEGLFSVVDGEVFEKRFIPGLVPEPYIKKALEHFKQHTAIRNPTPSSVRVGEAAKVEAQRYGRIYKSKFAPSPTTNPRPGARARLSDQARFLTETLVESAA